MLSHCPRTSNYCVGKNSPLNDLHFSRAGFIAIVETVQVKQTMDYVQAQLAREDVSESSSIAARSLGADENFAVLKRDHVGWPRFIHELPVQRRDPTIRDNQHRNLTELGEICLLFPGHAKAKLDGFSSELLKLDHIDWHFALHIVHGDFRRSRVIFSFHRNRRPWSKCLRRA
jgi:hypothetical protein